MPKGAPVANLPAFDGFRRGFVAGVWSELVFNGPAPDAGPVGFEIEAAEQFAGGGAVGGRRLGSEEFFQQGHDRSGPSWLMIAAGKTWRPDCGLALGAGTQILAVEFVEAGAGKS